MIQGIIILFCINLSADSLTQGTSAPKKSYTKQVIVNSVVGLGFGVGAGVFYAMSNKAYDDYKNSTTMTSAVDNWDKIRLYDAARNVCAVGALIFITRAVYYQLRTVKTSTSTGLVPAIELHYAYNGKLVIGLQKNL